MKYIIVTFLALVCVVLWYYGAISAKRKKFKNRSPVSKAKFYMLYQIEKKQSVLTKDEVIEILHFVASYLHLPPDRLLPNDSMKQLGPAYGWEYDDELNDFFNHFNLKLSQDSSLADLIELISIDVDLSVKILKIKK